MWAKNLNSFLHRRKIAFSQEINKILFDMSFQISVRFRSNHRKSPIHYVDGAKSVCSPFGRQSPRHVREIGNKIIGMGNR